LKLWSIPGHGLPVLIAALVSAAPIFVPGVLFPLGNLILALALFRARRLGAIASCTLALGALLFPIGHAIGIPAALIGGDVVLAAAFALILRWQAP
jgi:hypothetical protein